MLSKFRINGGVAEIQQTTLPKCILVKTTSTITVLEKKTRHHVWAAWVVRL